MKHLAAVAIACVLLAAGGAAAQPEQTPPPPLADRLPAGTIFYAGWAGRSLGLTWEGSAVGQLLREPVMERNIAALKQWLLEASPIKDHPATAPAWNLAALAWQRPIALAVLEVEPEAERVEAAVIIGVGEKREAFAAAVDKLLAAVAKPEQIKDVTIGAATFRQIAGPEEHEPVSFGFIENRFVLTLGERAPQMLLAVQPEASLATADRFTAAMKPVAGENTQLALWLDAAKVQKLLKQAFPPGEAAEAPPAGRRPNPATFAWALAEALGLAKVDSVVGTVRIVERGMLSTTRIVTPAPHRGALLPLAGAPLRDADLAGVPADALFAAALNLSPSAALAELRRALASAAPEAAEELEEGLAEAQEELGVSIERDLLGNLGDTWVLASAPSYGGWVTGTVLSVEVTDEKALAAALAKIEAFANRQMNPQRPREGRVGEARADGAPPAQDEPTEREAHPARTQFTFHTHQAGPLEIRYLSGALPDVPLPVKPAWAVHKGRLYVAAWPQVIQAAVENAGANPLTADAHFQRLRAQLGPRASALVYVNQPKLTRAAYTALLPLATMGLSAGRAHVNLPETLGLPALSRLEKHVWGQLSTVRSDEGGITFQSYGSSIGLGMANPAAAGLMTSALVPALARSRGLARRAVSASNVHQISLGVHMYAADHDGAMPPDIDSLLPYVGSAEVFVSPASGRKPPRVVDGKIVGEVDYVYLPWTRLRAIGDPTRAIIAYERPENYDGKETNVAFADGHVERMPMGAFRRALDRSEKARRKAAGGAE